MRDYELVLVISPDVGDEGFPTTVERVSKFIQERGGQIKDTDQWGRRRLAYPITRFTEGFYAVTHFSIEPTELRALEGNLGLAEDVLRHLVVRQEEAPLLPPKDSPAPQEEAPLLDQEEEPVVVGEEEPVVAGEEEAEVAGEEEPVAAQASAAADGKEQ